MDMDIYLQKMYANKDFDNCYKLSKIVSAKNYSEYTLAPFNIKFKESMIFVSDSAKYYEYKSLKEINIETFYYFYAIKNEEVSKYFNKTEVYPKFISWVDSLYNSPIDDGFDEAMDNKYSKKYRYVDDIPVIKNERLKNFKLAEIYKKLYISDTISLKKIFNVDNSELIKIVKNRNEKESDLLNLPSDDFNIAECIAYPKYENILVKDSICRYFYNLFNNKRFITEDQIFNYLFLGTNFTDEEKMFVSFYFINCFLQYNKSGKYIEYSDINKILLYRQTVCNGYALLLRHFLTKNNIECYKITINTNIDSHANNIVVINNKVYYVDVTWSVYYRDINNYPQQAIISKYQTNPVKINYSNIKNFTYIVDIDDSDYFRVVDKFKYLVNKKGSM